jgi:hypothetical protein
VSAKRQKNQLELAFGVAAKGEAQSATTEGTEAIAATARPESPAAVDGGDCRARQSAEGARAGLLTRTPAAMDRCGIMEQTHLVA